MNINKSFLAEQKNTRYYGENGFTILELIMVIIIIGIITAVAIVPFGSHEDRVAQAVANMIITDIAYAQELAQIRNTGVVVTFDPGQWFAGNPLEIKFQEPKLNVDSEIQIELAELHSQQSLYDKIVDFAIQPIAFISGVFVSDAMAGHKHGKGKHHGHHHGPGKHHGHNHCADCGEELEDEDDGDKHRKKHKKKHHKDREEEQGDDEDDDDHGKGKGKGHDDDDDDDDHGKGKGKGHDDDDDDDGKGKGKGHDDNGKGKGKGHHDHGKGKGKGHDHDDDEDEIDPGGYTLTYMDGTPVSTPEYTTTDFENTSGDLIVITSPPRTLIFDGNGVLHVPDYNWGANETSMVACTLNDRVNIIIARFSGKSWSE